MTATEAQAELFSAPGLGIAPRLCPVCGWKVDRLQGSPGAGAGRAHIVCAYPCQCWLDVRQASRLWRGVANR